MNAIVKDKIPQLVELCKKYRVVRMYLFGSAARDDDFDPETSDIDLLIMFSSQVKLLELADAYFDLMFELEDMFGRKIDLVTENMLRNPYFIKSIDEDKKLIYEEAA